MAHSVRRKENWAQIYHKARMGDRWALRKIIRSPWKADEFIRGILASDKSLKENPAPNKMYAAKKRMLDKLEGLDFAMDSLTDEEVAEIANDMFPEKQPDVPKPLVPGTRGAPTALYHAADVRMGLDDVRRSTHRPGVTIDLLSNTLNIPLDTMKIIQESVKGGCSETIVCRILGIPDEEGSIEKWSPDLYKAMDQWQALGQAEIIAALFQMGTGRGNVTALKHLTTNICGWTEDGGVGKKPGDYIEGMVKRIEKTFDFRMSSPDIQDTGEIVDIRGTAKIIKSEKDENEPPPMVPDDEEPPF